MRDCLAVFQVDSVSILVRGGFLVAVRILERVMMRGTNAITLTSALGLLIKETVVVVATVGAASIRRSIFRCYFITKVRRLVYRGQVAFCLNRCGASHNATDHQVRVVFGVEHFASFQCNRLHHVCKDHELSGRQFGEVLHLPEHSLDRNEILIGVTLESRLIWVFFTANHLF